MIGFNQYPKHKNNLNNRTRNILPLIRFILFKIPKQRLQCTDLHTQNFFPLKDGSHQIFRCEKSKNVSPEERHVNARTLGLCFNCMSPTAPVERLLINIHMQNYQLPPTAQHTYSPRENSAQVQFG